MLTWILWVLAVVAVIAVAFGLVFFLGMRTKNPIVQGAVRRFNRAYLNPRQLATAGQPGAYASLIRHVGRTSGAAYETPVGAFPVDDGLVVALPYGATADWVKNVLARGTATVVHEGQTYEVDRPEVLPTSAIESSLPPGEVRNLHRFKVEQGLRLHIVG